MVLKIVYDRTLARVLGGAGLRRGRAWRSASTRSPWRCRAGSRSHDLAEVDLAYAPPYSSANDPLNLAAFVGAERPVGVQPAGHGARSSERLLRPAPPAGSGPLVLDVRNLNEYEAAHIRGALNIPVDELRFRLDEVPRDRPIVVHCRSGFRSHLALRILKENGWNDVRNLTGGFVAVPALGGFDIE